MKNMLLIFSAFFLVPFIAGAADCTVRTEQNKNECRLATYTFDDNNGLIGTRLQQAPEGLAVPTMKELGESGDGEIGQEILALIPIENLSTDRTIFAYVVDLWYANRTNQTATRYLFKYNAKKELLKDITIIETQSFCDYPYFVGVPTPCRAKGKIDVKSDFSQYCGVYRQVDGPKNYSGGANLLVKQLLSEKSRTSLLLTLNPGVDYSEVNVAVTYDAKKKEFVFNSGEYGYCEDPDCEGIESIRGRLITMVDQAQYAIITATIFKAEETDLKTYEQTWIYRADTSNGSYCHL